LLSFGWLIYGNERPDPVPLYLSYDDPAHGRLIQNTLAIDNDRLTRRVGIEDVRTKIGAIWPDDGAELGIDGHLPEEFVMATCRKNSLSCNGAKMPL